MKYISNKQIKLFLLIFVLVALGSIVFKPFKASALSGSDFRAGRIIDDSILYNGSAMSAGEIQNFLNAKVPVCDTNGTQPSNRSGYATRADWGRANGYGPSYICLKDYSENTPAKAADSYCSAYSGGSKSAAQIIRDVGVACNISQKSMIVLLQKEQSLITDDWPWSNQYRSATGYGCPDTAPCDAEYYGFFNQVYNAARQFQRYRIQSNIFNYRAGQTSYVQFNPNSNCGGTNVYIENSATAGLYNYTPYQPNASALNNLYGSGDACGAYGNRNFWRLYNDWFGSTSGPEYAWQWEGQAVFTDETKATSIDTDTKLLTPGSRYYVMIRAKNVGTSTWSNSDFKLGTSRPLNSASPVCDSTWANCGRPATLFESSVAPGQTGTFQFWIKVPLAANTTTKAYFNPLRENIAWANDIGLHFTFTTGSYQWQWEGQAVFTDETKATSIDTNTKLLTPGSRYYVMIRAKNVGTSTWQRTQIGLGTSSPLNRLSPVCDSTWANCGRPATLFESSVAPGQTGTFQFWIKVPLGSGESKEYFTPLFENVTWFNDLGLHFIIRR
ncbi:MAG: hypothetical protein NTV95_01490 [Candidatus Saccharibacteria bacterium]|nr:hypothetical protein [Candidatus Saccharibacteria bacterium]